MAKSTFENFFLVILKILCQASPSKIAFLCDSLPASNKITSREEIKEK